MIPAARAAAVNNSSSSSSSGKGEIKLGEKMDGTIILCVRACVCVCFLLLVDLCMSDMDD